MAAGTATMSYVASNTCGADTTTHAITIIGPPNPGTISAANRICIGSSAICTDTITGGKWTSASSAVSIDSVTGHLLALSGGVATVTYTVSNSCLSSFAIRNVSIDTFPTLSNTLMPTAICSGDPFDYSPASTSPSPSFIWSRSSLFGIANPADSGYGGIHELLTDTLNTSVHVPYIITITSGACTNAQSIMVTVKPLPKLTTPTTTTTCSGALLNYPLPASIAGTTVAWTRDPVTGILPASGSGMDGISEHLQNTTTSAVHVPYKVLLTASGCNNMQTVDVLVSPMPTFMPHITTQSPSVTCNNTQYQNFGAAVPPPAGITYEWKAVYATLYATGSNSQYCLVNFDRPAMAEVHLNAYPGGYACPTSDSFFVVVNSTVADMPDVIYFNGSFVCNHNDENRYQWGYDDAYTLDSTLLTGETNESYANATPDLAGKYYWVMTGYDRCPQKSYFRKPLLSAVLNTPATDVRLFPNPNTGTFTISGRTMEQEQMSFVVRDVTGRIVFTGIIQPVNGIIHETVRLNPSLPPGNYYIRFLTGNNVIVLPFIRN